MDNIFSRVADMFVASSPVDVRKNTPMKRIEKIWTQFESLLEEAVSNDDCLALEMLLQSEKEGPLRHIPIFKQRSLVALFEAIENENLHMIECFFKYNYTLQDKLHHYQCECATCIDDNLGLTKYRLGILKGLSSHMWISIASKDPFLTIFENCQMIKDFEKSDVCHNKNYHALYETNTQLSLMLLDEVQTKTETATLLRHEQTRSCGNDPCCELSLVITAIDYKQKLFVTHPVVQQNLNAKVFNDIPHWQKGSIVYRSVLVILMALIWPITTLLTLLCPACVSPTLAGLAMKPFVKFVNCASSFLTFLVLMVVFSSSRRQGIAAGKSPPLPLEITIFVWLMGFCWGEWRQIYKNGIKLYLRQGWNWVDIGMDGLMLFSYTVWFVVSYEESISKDQITWEKLLYLADGAFTAGIILSFFRIIYLCQITRYLGLLQLCLKEMIMVMFQFAFICTVVLIAFTTGMMFLTNAKHAINGTTAMPMLPEYDHDSHEDHSSLYEALSESFAGFESTFFTMVYVSLTMDDRDVLKPFEDGTLIQLWANLMFIVYYTITMIIIMNMLIAMMNTSYTQLYDNMAMEHLYARTSLWLEYIGNEQTRPIPFNMLPAKRNFMSFVNFFSSKCSHGHGEKDKEMQQKQQHEYRKLCKKLMERYMCKINKNNCGKSVNHQKNPVFLGKIDNFFESWKDTFDEYVKEAGLSSGLENISYIDGLSVNFSIDE